MQRLTRLLSNSACANDDINFTGSEELVAHRSYPRPRVVVDDLTDIELSDEIVIRLWVARMKALEKYDQVQG